MTLNPKPLSPKPLSPKPQALNPKPGTVLHRTGQFSTSADVYTRALAISPSSPNLHYNLANSLLDAGIQTGRS
jgi:hypothetical protein